MVGLRHAPAMGKIYRYLLSTGVCDYIYVIRAKKGNAPYLHE